MSATLSETGGPIGRIVTARPRSGRRRRAGILAPGLVVALAVALVVAAGVAGSGGNATGFVHFGRAFAPRIGPPRGAVVLAGTGYDGQYFWALAQDPLVRRARTVHAFAGESFRLQRLAYPLLAYLVAGGHAPAIPWALVAVNVIAILGGTLAFAAYARRRGWSTWWSLAVGLAPGFMYALVADLSDAVAVVAMLGGLIAWRHGRRWPAAALLTVAGLAREPMMLAVAAIALESAGTAWSARARARELRRLVAHVWPAVVVPVAAFGGWQLYIHSRFPGSTSDPGTAFAAPFTAVATEAGRALHNGRVSGAWDLCYLGLMLVAIGLAIVHVRRGRSATAIAAMLFGLILPVLVFGYAISYTRLSAPLFACLLVVGLERRSRATLWTCAAVAALGALVPLGIG